MSPSVIDQLRSIIHSTTDPSVILRETERLSKLLVEEQRAKVKKQDSPFISLSKNGHDEWTLKYCSDHNFVINNISHGFQLIHGTRNNHCDSVITANYCYDAYGGADVIAFYNEGMGGNLRIIGKATLNHKEPEDRVIETWFEKVISNCFKTKTVEPDSPPLEEEDIFEKLTEQLIGQEIMPSLLIDVLRNHFEGEILVLNDLKAVGEDVDHVSIDNDRKIITLLTEIFSILKEDCQ